MIRMVGAVLLAMGSAALGFGAVRHLDGRVHDLRQVVVGLETIKRELGWSGKLLPELLEQAGQESKGRPAVFFGLCAQKARRLNGQTFHQVWQQGMEAAQMRLEPVDSAVIEQLGNVLGRYDGESQQQALEQALERLGELQKQAAEQRLRLGKVYGTLGITAGVFLIILLV